MVPEIFIDGFGQVFFKDGLIRIELVSRSGDEPEVRQRIIMTVPAFLNALQLQQTIVNKFEEAGIIRAPVLKFPPQPAPARAAAAAAAPAVATAAAAAPAKAAPAGPPKSPNFSEK